VIFRDSYYIILILTIIAWVMIGMKIRLSQMEATAEAVYVIQTSPTEAIPLANPPPPTISDSGILWLVNQDTPLTPSFTPQSLVTHQGIHLHPSAYTAYNHMLNAMVAEGLHGLHLASAYRTYEYQQNLFANKVNTLISQGYSNDEAAEIAAKTVHPPGASEHQTGLALDVTISGDLTQAFGDTNAGRWIAANSHRFGFIIRYPQAKTDITHTIYEPWHLRYVGIPHAIIMQENNLTLEEYSYFIASTSAYIVWANPGETHTYYLVVHSYTFPEKIPQGMIDISSDRQGDGASFIMTFIRE